MSDAVHINEIDPAIRDAVTQCIRLRAEAKELQETAESKVKLANEMLSSLFEKYGLEAVVDENGNTIRKKDIAPRLNTEKLKMAMLAHGVSPDDVMAILDEGKGNPSSTFEFRRAKE